MAVQRQLTKQQITLLQRIGDAFKEYERDTHFSHEYELQCQVTILDPDKQEVISSSHWNGAGFSDLEYEMNPKVSLKVQDTTIKILESFPENSNPFQHDMGNMGVQLGSNLTAMLANFENSPCKFVIICRHDNGQRIKLSLE